MKNLKNSVQLIGRLGKDPVIINLDGNKTLAKFSLATTEYFKNKNGEKSFHTTWHNIVTWGKTALIAEKFLEKGKEIALTGKLVHRTYADKNGMTKYSTEIVANELVMIGSKK